MKSSLAAFPPRELPFQFRWQRRRKSWPLGSIQRADIPPYHPLPAIVLCVCVYFATFLGYADYLISIMVLFIIASLCFTPHRYNYLRRDDQFTMPWPRPRGYEFRSWPDVPGASNSSHTGGQRWPFAGATVASGSLLCPLGGFCFAELAITESVAGRFDLVAARYLLGES